ncbi:hypothetical protein MUN82_05000 [Hymenobacter aerilatus]|uniref:Uncharacterized protein n=1 Tax=Hymenobacter aerilatus TaxID=2932251 RepID=A0A8T9SZT7_9BACT|nr:hypothetical protein [Hymenobacter aerilatus]UOR06454.1 hypothetical protein MUN82_05000 [Hymenobacter aerilatus]
MNITITISVFSCLWLSALTVLSQVSPSVSPPLPAAIRRALPAGYQVLAAEKGDLNRDALPDYAVVLHRPDEQKTSDVIDHPTKRPLLLFVGGAGGTYTLAARSDNAVYCVDCGGMMGDPFQGLTLKNGYFTVEHYGGSGQRWTRLITFRYDATARTWLLHRDGGEYFDASDPEHSKTTMRTAKNFGRVVFTKFDIYKEE